MFDHAVQRTPALIAKRLKLQINFLGDILPAIIRLLNNFRRRTCDEVNSDISRPIVKWKFETLSI